MRLYKLMGAHFTFKNLVKQKLLSKSTQNTVKLKNPCQVFGKFFYVTAYNLKLPNMPISCNIGKSAKNSAGIIRFFYVTAYLHVLMQQKTEQNVCLALTRGLWWGRSLQNCLFRFRFDLPF